jgi:hypothetical protein
MLGWLYRMIIGRFSSCEHKWAKVATLSGKYMHGGGECHRWIMQCEKCGKVHTVDIT